MDQMIVATARIGHAMLFDCRAFMRKAIPIPPEDLRVVIANTMVKHDLTGVDGKSAYAQRREQCGEGVTFFKTVNPKVKSLRDVTLEMVEQAKGKVSGCVFRRCRHVVGETQRCQDAANELVTKNYKRVGELMWQSHVSLRDDYEVSCAELDYLSEEAMKVQGVYGARMTGGGFGGCIVALAQPAAADHLMNHLRIVYKEKYNIDPVVFATTATSGAGVME
jgi:galactokinase